MGKKSSKSASPMKASKLEMKPQLNLMKILRPKVYITDSSNFKTLVQELTGNGNYAAVETSPPPVHLSPATWEVPYLETYQDSHHQHHNLVYQDNMTISSSVDMSLPESVMAGEMEERQKMEFYKGLEAMLMEMDSDYSCDYAQIFRQDDEVCVYDYDLSNFV